MLMKSRGPGRGVNKSDQSFSGQGRGGSNGQDRVSKWQGRGRNGQSDGSNGQGRGARPQPMTSTSDFNYSSGRGGLASKIQPKRLPSFEAKKQKVAEDLPEVRFEAAVPMDVTQWPPKAIENVPIKSTAMDDKPVPFGGNAVKIHVPPDVIHEPSKTTTIAECSASVISGGTSTSIINGGSVAPTNISTSQCHGCTLLRQRMVTMLRTAANTFNEFADAFQEFQQEKNN
ncbi:hypothetical protein ACQ4LE_003967 [Meloidogyne hapla]|uniref:BAT2_N domain-containing protein n=1 Tax=Meloidogyne hapla TaxID=6305 RepID=A0A1I8BPH3_MELHA